MFQVSDVSSQLIRGQESLRGLVTDQTGSASWLPCSWQGAMDDWELRLWAGCPHPTQWQSQPAVQQSSPGQRLSAGSKGDLAFFLVYSIYPSPRTQAKNYWLKWALHWVSNLLKWEAYEIVTHFLIYKSLTYVPSVLSSMIQQKSQHVVGDSYCLKDKKIVFFFATSPRGFLVQISSHGNQWEFQKWDQGGSRAESLNTFCLPQLGCKPFLSSFNRTPCWHIFWINLQYTDF